MAWPRPAVRLLPLLLLLLPGCAEPGAPGSDGNGDGLPPEQEVALEPGWSLDLEYVLSSGAGIAWSYSASSPVYFQFMNVEGGQAYPLVAEHSTEGRGERTAPRAGRYDLVWQNDGLAALTLRYRAPEGAIVATWPPGEGPACPPALLARDC